MDQYVMDCGDHVGRGSRTSVNMWLSLGGLFAMGYRGVTRIPANIRDGNFCNNS